MYIEKKSSIWYIDNNMAISSSRKYRPVWYTEIWSILKFIDKISILSTIYLQIICIFTDYT